MRTGLALAAGVVAGMVVGAALTYRFTNRSVAHAPSALSALHSTAGSALAARTGRASPAAAEDARPSSTAERADIYRSAADADAAQLESLVAGAAAKPLSSRRDFELATLLVRYAELDPVRAVELAGELDLRPDLAAPLYATWAQRDPDAALETLRTVAAPADTVSIAVAMLPALGRDGFERILAALGPDASGNGAFFGNN